jgi:hypothetical protein
MTTKKRLFEVFEHVTGIQPSLSEEIPSNDWTAGTIVEFMDSIGQDEQRMMDRNSGYSSGDYGRIKFRVQNNTLYMDFQTPEIAHLAINKLSDALSNPYEFYSRFDEMPNTVMVQFTNNGIDEGDLTYAHANGAAPEQDQYQLGMEEGLRPGIRNVAAKDLRTGDVLSSGSKIFSSAFAGVRTPKGKVEIGVEYPGGKRKIQLWNRSTLIGVMDQTAVNPAPQQTNQVQPKNSWDILDRESKFNILLKFLKNPDEAEQMADMTYDQLPEPVLANVTRDQQQPVDEISSDLFKKAIGMTKDRGQDNRTNKLGRTFFTEFTSKPLFGGTISDIIVNNPQQGNYSNVSIEILPTAQSGQNLFYIYYDIDKDHYELDYPISRKDARTLSLIAAKINPQTQYRNGTGDFKIREYGMN